MSNIRDDDFVRVKKGVTPHSGRRLRVASWGGRGDKEIVNLRVPTDFSYENILVYDADEVERIKRVRDRVKRL
jgi:hypothetical protein